MTVDLVTRVQHPELDEAAYLARIERLLALAGVSERELSVSWVDDAHIQSLNHQWRDRNRPTDVLSFEQGEVLEEILDGGPPAPLGDVVISVERAEVQARERDVSLGGVGYTLLDELTFLTLHGVLHLLGHDHENEAEAVVMEALEARIFAEFSAWPPRPHHREGAS